MADNKIKELQEAAKQIRILTIEMLYKIGSGHIGPSLSMVEIITALLFDRLNWRQFLSEVRDKSHEDQWRYWHDQELKRDRFVISKGHAVPSWYAALALAGYIDKKELLTLRQIDSRLQGHPERKRFPFIDATTGSLGQGQSEAMGYALAKKLAGRPEKIYCIIGDGECNEGQIWETALSAPKFKLDNLIIILDYNKKQGEGYNKDVMNLEPMEDKWRAFNWHVQRADGHNIASLLYAFTICDQVKGQPHIIIADTHKGYLGNGELFMNGGHNVIIDEENYKKAINFLGL